METHVKNAPAPPGRAGNRHLFFALGFAAAAMIAWNVAGETYRKRLAVVTSGNNRFNVSLETVVRHQALFPARSLEDWLGPSQAVDAHNAQAKYRQAFAVALVCGFFAVFWFGMHLDAFRSDQFVPRA